MVYKRVVAVQDDSSHWYVIPFELKDEFYEMASLCEDVEEWYAFDKIFSEYMTGGDLNLTALYIKDGK